MIDYGIQCGSVAPQPVDITEAMVYINSDVTPYNEEIDGRVISGYKYHCIGYTKDEYLTLQNEKLIALEQELAAAKILLGVD